MWAEAKSAAAVAGSQNLLVAVVLMVRCQVEWAGVTTFGVHYFFLYQFLIIPANIKIPVSMCEVTEDFKKKRGKREGKG